MRTLALLALVVIAGCEDEAPTPDASTAFPLPLDARMKRLDAALSRAALNGSSLAKQQLVATAAGRMLLARVVSCAMPAGTKITGVADDGTPYQFAGGRGLAPSWADHPVLPAERSRVSACVQGQLPPAPAPLSPMVGALPPGTRRV